MQGINQFTQITPMGEIKNATNICEHLDAPRSVIVFVNGITINCKRCLAGHAEIVHKYSSNCGFQDNEKNH